MERTKLIVDFYLNECGGIKRTYICEYCEHPLIEHAFFPCRNCGKPVNHLVRSGFNIIKQKFDGIAAFKTYVKMALTIMPEDKLDKFGRVMDWIKEKPLKLNGEWKHSNFYGNNRGILLKSQCMKMQNMTLNF
ncbi:MAG: hypothetical protein FWF78_08075 [Defluviitaleaceae bacterium]|nr:hypothetical protein [Defluviitaleaceae bacterium]